MEIINFDSKKTKKKYNLLPFLPPPPFRCIISGSSGSGKTNLLVNMMTHKEGWKQVFRPQDIILISSTLGLDDKLNKINVKPENKFDKFDAKIIDDIMEQQHQLMTGKVKRKAPQLLLILDDLASENVLDNNTIIKRLSYKGRHYNISFICLTQKYNQISPVMRRNSNLIILFEPKNLQEFDLIVDEQIDKDNKKKFKDMMLKAYEDPYSFISINYTNQMDKYVKNFKEVLKL